MRAYLERRRPPELALRGLFERRHAEAFLPLVGAYDGLLASGLMTYSVPLEWANVTAVLDRLAMVTPSDDTAAHLLVAYSRSWRNVLYNNHDPRRLGWLDAAAAAAQRVGEKGEHANVLKAQGDVLAFQDQRDEALAKYEAALGLFRAVGARLGEANVLKAQGDVLAFQDRRDEALAKYEAALGLFRAVGARLGEANVLLVLGDLLRALENYPEAWKNYQAVHKLYTSIGDGYSQARVLYRMGDWYVEQERQAEAVPMYEEAIRLWQSIGLDDLVNGILLPRLRGATDANELARPPEDGLQ